MVGMSADSPSPVPADEGHDDPLRIEPPDRGRIHSHRRRIQFADVSPAGRLRLDALARFLQDISDEDTIDAGFPPDEAWVVRRVELAVRRFPVVRDLVTVTTWGSGVGGRWAERRVRVEVDGDVAADAAVLWVHLDASGRPAKLSGHFHDVYAEAVRGRKVRAKLHHGARPDGLVGAPFPLRVSDFDPMDHVNNAVSWIPVEQALFDRRSLRAPLRVSMEHAAAIERDSEPEVAVVDVEGGFDLWIDAGGRTCSSVQLRPHP